MLFTEPIPILSILVFSISVVAVLFLVRVFISNRLLSRTLKEKPLILLMGPPKSGKKKILKKLTNAKVKTKIYPFIGRFRVADVFLKNKDHRLLCFHCVTDHKTLKKENIKLLDKKPNFIIFVVDVSSDFNRIKNQKDIFEKSKKIYSGIPSIAAMNKYDTAVKTKEIRKLFGKGMITTPLTEETGIVQLREKMEKLIT